MTGARALIAHALGIEDVPVSASAADLPGWDSLGHMRIVLAIEARRGHPLSAEELARIWDVASVEEALSRPPGDR